MKRAAIVGMGAIYPIHSAAIQALDGIELVGVCDIDAKKRAAAPEGVPAFENVREMVEQTHPDCVHVCLPHYLHYPISKQVVEMGVNVLCEKPVALNGREALEFRRLEQEHPEVKIAVSLQNRLNETTEELVRIIGSGEHGKVMGIRAEVPWYRPLAYYQAGPWRGSWDQAGSGVMMNQAIHTIDLMYLLGGPVQRIKASVEQILDYGIEVEDTVSARFQYENGAIGHLYATNANFKNEGVNISVDLECASFRMRDNVLYEVGEGNVETKLVEDQKLPGSKFYYGASHKKLIRGFYDCLEDGSDEYIHVRDAYMSVHLIDVIKDSGLTGSWANV